MLLSKSGATKLSQTKNLALVWEQDHFQETWPPFVLSFEEYSQTGQTRSKSLRACFTEGHMQEGFDSLQAQREEAKSRQVVKRTEVLLCDRDAASLWGHSGMI